MKAAYGDNLYLEPSYRGRGIGAQTMNHLFELTAQKGCRYFIGDVEYDNFPARRLYGQLDMESISVMHANTSCPLGALVRVRKDVSAIHHSRLECVNRNANTH